MLALLLAGLVTPVRACPFCGEPTLTLSEQLGKADDVVLAEWVSNSDKLGAQSTKYEIVQIARDPLKKWKIGQNVTVERLIPGKSGNLALLLGKRPTLGKTELTEWRDPIEITEVAYQYVLQAPSPETPVSKRLAYFSRFLEFGDPVIAKDAYGEFANSSYKDIVPVAKKLSAAKIRKWIFDSNRKELQTRRGLYGMLLGLCGDGSDIARLEEVIRENPVDELRLGIDGMIGGYLLLAGADGLAVIEKAKFLASNVPFSETHSTLNALRFLWTYGEGRIPAERLRESLRLLLNQPQLAELAVIDLARWKDWKIQPQLMKLYDSGGEYSDVRMKRAIIKFMLVSTRDLPKGLPPNPPAADLPGHVRFGLECIETLRGRDPALVAESEKYFPRAKSRPPTKPAAGRS